MQKPSHIHPIRGGRVMFKEVEVPQDLKQFGAHTTFKISEDQDPKAIRKEAIEKASERYNRHKPHHHIKTALKWYSGIQWESPGIGILYIIEAPNKRINRWLTILRMILQEMSHENKSD